MNQHELTCFSALGARVSTGLGWCQVEKVNDSPREPARRLRLPPTTVDIHDLFILCGAEGFEDSKLQPH